MKAKRLSVKQIQQQIRATLMKENNMKAKKLSVKQIQEQIRATLMIEFEHNKCNTNWN